MSIVIYKESQETLSKIIESFFSLEFEKELIIVDNSPENILKSFLEQFNIVYIFTGNNMGFGAGHNLAFQHKTLDSDIHIIANPDIFFDNEELKGLIDWFGNEKDISLITPLVCNSDGSIQNIIRDIPTPLSLLKRKLKIDLGEKNIKLHTIEEVPFAHGCFMVFKTEVYEKLNGFDERFFMYMEDVDIFIRAKKYGKTVINTNYKIYHEYRKASSKNIKLFLWHLSSAVKFFLKYNCFIKNKF